MTPPNNTNKPRQFLKPGLPFQETPTQDNAESFLLGEAPPQGMPSWITGEHASQQPYNIGMPSGVNASEQPWLFASPGMQNTPPESFLQQSFAQPQMPEAPSSVGQQQTSQFSPFLTGKQAAQQFRPLATGEYASQSYPITGKQQIQPLPPTGLNLPGRAYPGTQPSVPSMPAQPGMQAMPGFQMRAPALPAYPGTQPSMPSMPAQPGMYTSSSAMPAYPGASRDSQYISAARPAVGTGSYPSAYIPAAQRSSARMAAVAPGKPRKPIKIKQPGKAGQEPGKAGQKKTLPVLGVAVCIVLVIAVVLVSQRNLLFGIHAKTQSSIQTNTHIVPTPSTPPLNSITNNKEISPFLFGANMALFHDNDEPILNSAATRRQLQDIGVRIIRMPTRTTLKPETTITAAKDIKAMGASALVVMHGPEFKDAPLYESDHDVIQTIVNVFGSQPVYFEFGNESDLNGIDVNQYILKWNQVIPKLKKDFPTARFIALDNYQFTRRYMKTFLQQANPLPDGVSWHEYTCSVYWTAQFCLANLDTWAVHFAQARAAMQEAIHKELPIWVSEWNYTSDQAIVNGQPINDGKYNDPNFMQTWTTKAMQLLIENRIFAAMQYFATDPPMPLVANDQIGIEGKIFQDYYKKVMVDGVTPPASYYQGPPPPMLNPNAQYSFETAGASGWTAVGGGITPPTSSAMKALDGSRSLWFNLANTSEDDTPFISVNASTMPSTPKGGQMISAYIYVANPNALINAKIFVADPSRAWHFANSLTLTPGKWTKIWYSLPVNFSNQVTQLGIQFFTSRVGESSDVYIDGIEWK